MSTNGSNKQQRNYLVKVYQAQKIERYETHSIVRFLRHIRTIKWQKGQIKAYLRVSYGKFPDHCGRLATFYNDGSYANKKDFELTLKAFLE